MKPAASNTGNSIKRMVGLYNMLPNMLWSILGLTPISIFCYNHLAPALFYPFLGISFLLVLLPHSFLDKLQISKKPATYKKLGVGIVQQLSQNGEIINKVMRRKFPGYRVVLRSSKSINGLLKQTYVLEKFHSILFLFFILAGVYALTNGYIGWTVVITLTNLLYNVYPILLQQYIRLKLAPFNKKRTEQQAENFLMMN